MSNPLMQTIEALAKEKGIEADVVITAIEDAVLTASRKYYKTNENLKTRFNQDTGQVDLFAVKQIVRDVQNPATEISLEEAQQLYGDEAEVDMEIEFPKPTEVLGRIAAQTAKQVIFQKVREAERENIFGEYSQRIGEVVNATVKRFENGDMVVELGRIEASLPRKEQSRAESYAPGERLRTVIKGVNRSTKGPQIVLSRTDPALLVKLFEQEVPEIYDGTVQIRGAVREAGDRAKVAVFSRERDVDPVGACVGMKGTRVQAIIRELRGEKIDIVEWSDDPVALVTNALSPAKVQRVSIVDDKERVVEVVVEDKQLSLAIGKKGQNVRLAAKLTGWRIDIKSEEEKRREIEAQFEGFADDSSATEEPAEAEAAEVEQAEAEPAETEAAAAVADESENAAPSFSIAGIGDKTMQRLISAGYDSTEKIALASVDALSEVQGIGAKTAERILAAVRGEAPAEEEQA
jgi:N utilization substance protein A